MLTPELPLEPDDPELVEEPELVLPLEPDDPVLVPEEPELPLEVEEPVLSPEEPELPLEPDDPVLVPEEPELPLEVEPELPVEPDDPELVPPLPEALGTPSAHATLMTTFACGAWSGPRLQLAMRPLPSAVGAVEPETAGPVVT